MSDLKPLAQLTNLQSLYLAGTQVSDLTSLKELASLQILNLINTQADDFSALDQLPNLRILLRPIPAGKKTALSDYTEINLKT